MKKVYIQTHGCQMNEYDSAKMLELLGEKSNFQTTENEAEADLLVLNTCSIREKAQERVFHQVGRWKSLKEKNYNVFCHAFHFRNKAFFSHVTSLLLRPG